MEDRGVRREVVPIYVIEWHWSRLGPIQPGNQRRDQVLQARELALGGEPMLGSGSGHKVVIAHPGRRRCWGTTEVTPLLIEDSDLATRADRESLQVELRQVAMVPLAGHDAGWNSAQKAW